MTHRKRTLRELATGLGFLLPNILGFLTFTTIPLVFSMVLAFSNWDLKRHNMFKEESISFLGIDNFIRLFSEPDFWQYLGNTLFFMMNIPFAIGGSLLAAILLSKDLDGGSRRAGLWLFASAVMVASLLMLIVVGMGSTGMTILICGLASMFLVGGTLGRTSVYRTLFYLPHFTAGVATFILWKKLYNPYTGPINQALRPMFDKVTNVVVSTPTPMIQAGFWAAIAIAMGLLFLGLRKMANQWRDGDLGSTAMVVPTIFLLLPAAVSFYNGWLPTQTASFVIGISAVCLLVWHLFGMASSGQEFPCKKSNGFGSAAMLALAFMVLQFILIGLGLTAYHLPVNAAVDGGLQPPFWLTSVHWAKPAIMMMGLWGAIGSNNMLLYLAALTNVPGDLYEAADIDGASRFQKFWNVTWPQLAPTTFFIVVMSMIHGLQGGFEMARTMTQGGPAGATTTLSYFIYTEGFETGRLGYSSAVAWTLFAMVFTITMFNWKFGNRYVND